jgi:hypothetical protein
MAIEAGVSHVVWVDAPTGETGAPVQAVHCSPSLLVRESRSRDRLGDVAAVCVGWAGARPATGARVLVAGPVTEYGTGVCVEVGAGVGLDVARTVVTVYVTVAPVPGTAGPVAWKSDAVRVYVVGCDRGQSGIVPPTSPEACSYDHPGDGSAVTVRVVGVSPIW